MHGELDFPTRIIFGAGRSREAGPLTQPWGSRALVVTDPGVLAGEAAQPILDSLAAAGLDYQVFEGVEHNPGEAEVEAGARRFQAGCDFLVAVGGGTAIDTAKAIRLAVAHEGSLAQYFDTADSAVLIRPEMPPLLAVPTTAGTGSEVGRRAMLTFKHRKVRLDSPYLIPNLALYDPELTLGLPARMTADTGIDALTHNLDAYFATGFQPLCDAVALDGMKRAARWLEIAVQNGRDLAARTEMLLAAMMGGIALQKGNGLVLALSDALSSVAGVHYGTANAIMLPHALRYNRPAILERAPLVAQALGINEAQDPDVAVDQIIQRLETLVRQIGLPTALRQVNVSSALIGPLANQAMQEVTRSANPRTPRLQDIEEIFFAAL